MNRFIIDSHMHFDDRPDFFETLVAIYRPRNAMACVLTPMSGFEAAKRAAAANPDGADAVRADRSSQGG